MHEKRDKSSYAEQHKDVHTVESFGGEASYVDIRPEELSSDVPILVAGGWSEGHKSLCGAGEVIYDGGRRVLLVDHARRGRPTEDQEHPDFAKEVVHKANTLEKVLEDAGIERADIITHSEGSLNAILVALNNPERFRTIILTMPAGMIGEDTIAKLAGRFSIKLARGATKDLWENPKIGIAANLGGASYIAKNPVKAAREVAALADTSIDEVLEKLRKSGIKIGILQAHSDPVFPASRIEQHVRLSDRVDEGGITHFANADAYASVVAKDAGHDDLLIHPERSAEAALQMIESLSHEGE